MTEPTPSATAAMSRAGWLKPVAGSPDWPVGPPLVRWGLGAAFIGFLASQFLARGWGLAVVSVVWGGEIPDPLPIAYLPLVNAGLWIGFLGSAWLLSRTSGRGFTVDFDLRAPWPQYAVGAAAGVATQLGAIPLLYRVIGDAVGDPGALAQNLADQVSGPIDTVALLITTLVMAPWAEEVMYRGLILPSLSRSIGVLGGVLGSALLFAVVHPDPATYPGLFLFAVVAAVLVAKTGRLGVAVAAHFAFNLTTVALLLL